LPNVILTQHTAGGQPNEEEGRIEQLLRNLHHLRHGEPLENPVELARGY
jgi:phosphoglycerate dehydrogenase-like enzyme